MFEPESYREFLERISEYQKKEFSIGTEQFKLSDSVLKKVNADNTFADFYGDTVVFDLDRDDKDKIEQYINKLYDFVPDCFSERLKGSTLHMTLHDLSSSPQLSKVAAECFENEISLIKNRNFLGNMPKYIKMEATCVYKIYCTSVVLGLKPVNEAEYDTLMQLYNRVDNIRELNYQFAPHITLAYFNRKGFSSDDVPKLERIVNELNKQELTITLSTDNLFYEKFTNMNSYYIIRKIL